MINGVRRPCDGGLVQGAGPCVTPLPPGVGHWVLAATILGSSLAFIDGTVVSVALPAMQADLEATVTGLQWVVEAYAVLLAALVLVGGALGDRYGRRKVFIVGVVLFSVASAWCGLAGGIGQLIAARAIQGIGAALLVPSSLAIIGAYFPEAKRGQAIGTWSAFTSITMALGPVMGGWLIEQTSWRSAFFINVPLAVLVVAIAVWKVPESLAVGESGRLDWKGALTATAGLGLAVYGLLEWGNSGFGQSVLLSVGAGAVLLALFALVESRLTHPMMPPRLFRSSTFGGANLLTFLLYAAIGGMFFFLPLNLIQVQGYSPAQAGAAVLPFILIMSILSPWSGGLAARYGVRLFLTLGPAVTAIGLGLLALPGVGGSYWTTFFPPVVVVGIGMAITVAPLTTAVMGAVQPSYIGVASGVNNAVSRVGELIAVAVFGIVMFAVFNSSLDLRIDGIQVSPEVRTALDQERTRLAGAEVPPGVDTESAREIRQAIRGAYVDGFRLLMLLAAGLAVASSISAALMISGGRNATAGGLLTEELDPGEQIRPPTAA